MPRGLALNLLASALSILAAVTLLGATAFVGDGSHAAPDRARNAAVVHRFYDAVNDTLRMGDLAALDALLAPDLVVHTAPPGTIPGRAGLDHHLRTLRASDPSLQLLVEAITSDGDHAMARVAATGDAARTYLGLPLTSSPATWGANDAFRIANDRIAEIWVGAPAPVALEALREVELAIPRPGAQPLSLERLTAPAGTAWAFGSYVDSRVLVVVEGALSIEFTSLPPMAGQPGQATRGETVELASGDAISIPPGSRYVFRADRAEQGVTAFAVAAPQFTYDGPLQPPASADRDEDPEPPGASDAEVVALARVHASRSPGRATVAFGRLTLPPGERIGFGEGEATAFLVAESGALVVGQGRTAPELALLDPGSADVIAPGVAMTVSNPGDASVSVLLVSMLPVDESGKRSS